MLNSRVTKILFFISCLVFLIIVDLYLSNTLVENMARGLRFECPIFKLHYLENTGAAFNILKDAREALIIFSASAITLIFVYIFNHFFGHLLILVFAVALFLGRGVELALAIFGRYVVAVELKAHFKSVFIVFHDVLNNRDGGNNNSAELD